MCKELYLGDTLDEDAGADLAATARIRNGCSTECLCLLDMVP